ncbi:MAG: oxalate:formate antiporter [Opitutaceae bacterium]
MKLLCYWLLVAIPLGWGVTKSVQKSLPLFRSDAKPAAVQAK